MRLCWLSLELYISVSTWSERCTTCSVTVAIPAPVNTYIKNNAFLHIRVSFVNIASSRTIDDINKDLALWCPGHGRCYDFNNPVISSRFEAIKKTCAHGLLKIRSLEKWGTVITRLKLIFTDSCSRCQIYPLISYALRKSTNQPWANACSTGTDVYPVDISPSAASVSLDMMRVHRHLAVTTHVWAVLHSVFLSKLQYNQSMCHSGEFVWTDCNLYYSLGLFKPLKFLLLVDVDTTCSSVIGQKPFH